MGGAVVHARSWRLATLLALGLVLVALGTVGQPAGEYRLSDASISYHLRRFIEQTRGISSGQALVKRN
jgi:type IV secretory pathway TrbF-like protein